MGYTTKKYPPALGGIVDVAMAAKSVVEDPCLYETASLLQQLHAQEQPGTPGVPSTPPVKGIGLCKAVPYVRKIVWIRDNPWAGALIGVGIVGGLVGVGFLLGRRGRSSSSGGGK